MVFGFGTFWYLGIGTKWYGIGMKWYGIKEVKNEPTLKKSVDPKLIGPK